MPTSIEWTDESWNPSRGCALVSEGCRNCYAMRQAHRMSGPGRPYEGLTRMTEQGPKWTGRARPAPEALLKPLHWTKPRRIFVDSMSDWMHDDLSDDDVARILAVMWCAPWHTFQVLTKRSGRLADLRSADMLRRVLAQVDGLRSQGHGAQRVAPIDGRWRPSRLVGMLLRGSSAVPPWAWIGVSAEDQETWDRRTRDLAAIAGLVKVPWVSLEPMLERVALRLDEVLWQPDGAAVRRGGEAVRWIVIGGESGPRARMFDIEWARAAIAACHASDVPVFVKQLGSAASRGAHLGGGHDVWRTEWDDKEMHLRGLRDRKGGDWSEWPKDLRVREWPRGSAGGGR